MMTSYSEVPTIYPTSNSNPSVETHDWDTIRTSLIIYLPSFVVIIILFCYVRLKFPVAYNVRNTVELFNSPLAASPYGFFSWIWKIWVVADDDIFRTCGMDALCMLRITRMGSHLSLICVVCSIFLVPVYYHDVSSSEYSDDGFVARTATNLPDNSDSFTASVIGAYIIFGASMYLILKEFRWFIPQREKFLSLTVARNYTVYVSGIPRRHRDNAALERYFRRVIADDAVHSAFVLIHMPKLTAAVNLETKLIRNLERAQAIQELDCSNELMHTVLRPDTRIVQRVPAIPYIKNQLDSVRKEIQDLTTPLKARQCLTISGDNASNSMSHSEIKERTDVISTALIASGAFEGPSIELDLNLEKSLAVSEIEEDDVENTCIERKQKSLLSVDPPDTSHDNETFREPPVQLKRISEGTTDTDTSVKLFLPNSDTMCSASANLTNSNISKERNFDNDKSWLLGTAFVTFTKLSAVAIALQSVNSTMPFQMNVFEAPSPDQVLWNNVGIPNKVLQPRRLLTLIITALLCLFWTVPVSFVATLTEVEVLKEKLPFLEDWLEIAPWLEPFLSQISPLLISFLNSVVVPFILRQLSTLEGVIGLSHQEASLYSKLATFYLIQTFLVASFAGRITSALLTVDSIGDVFRYLAKTLPPQSIFYIQLLLIQTVIGMGCEMLRTTALIQALFRSQIGPNITEKDKREPYLGLRPLCAPRYFLYAHNLAGTSLRYMVLFTFTVLSPFISYVLLFSFLVLEIGFRHHLIYVYPSTLDSGGLLWLQFINITIICMFVAQAILMSFMAISKATRQMYAMFPLIISTVIFFAYLRQRHFTVAKYLSLETCDDIDSNKKFHEYPREVEFLNRMYLQPEIKEIYQ